MAYASLATRAHWRFGRLEMESSVGQNRNSHLYDQWLDHRRIGFYLGYFARVDLFLGNAAGFAGLGGNQRLRAALYLPGAARRYEDFAIV